MILSSGGLDLYRPGAAFRWVCFEYRPQGSGHFRGKGGSSWFRWWCAGSQVGHVVGGAAETRVIGNSFLWALARRTRSRVSDYAVCIAVWLLMVED